MDTHSRARTNPARTAAGAQSRNCCAIYWQRSWLPAALTPADCSTLAHAAPLLGHLLVLCALLVSTDASLRAVAAAAWAQLLGCGWAPHAPARLRLPWLNGYLLERPRVQGMPSALLCHGHGMGALQIGVEGFFLVMWCRALTCVLRL